MNDYYNYGYAPSPRPEPNYTPTEFLSVLNQTLDHAYGSVIIEGEISSLKTSQGKWVFFDLKDQESSINCFIPIFQLHIPLRDGMKVRVRAAAKVTKWGKFSLTIRQIQPVGEGDIKKAFELLKKKLAAEGLFNPAKKRPIPENLAKIGVISSTNAAGYADFIKILNARWGGMKVEVAHTQVQGLSAPEQIVRALNYFNEHSEVQIIAIIRGGGSADDLAAFNDEQLARAIAASKIPVITGIGHEVDESLADLAADVRASTPSNVAEMLSHDRNAEIRRVRQLVAGAHSNLISYVDHAAEKIDISPLKHYILSKILQVTPEKNDIYSLKRYIFSKIDQISVPTQRIFQVQKMIDLKLNSVSEKIASRLKILEAMNPEKVLRQGYAIISGKISPGSVVKITTSTKNINAEIKEIHDRN